MKKMLTLSLLTLCVSHGAAAANYALSNDNIALSFDDANATVVDDLPRCRNLAIHRA